MTTVVQCSNRMFLAEVIRRIGHSNRRELLQACHRIAIVQVSWCAILGTEACLELWDNHEYVQYSSPEPQNEDPARVDVVPPILLYRSSVEAIASKPRRRHLDKKRY